MVTHAKRGRTALRPAKLANLAALVLTANLAACDGTGVVIATSDEPFLYVALTPATPTRLAPGIYGMLLTTGTPLAASYREAERFELRRASDGVLFGWNDLGKTGPAPVGSSGTTLFDANYFLPDTAAAGRLSALDIRPGGAYELHVVTRGVTVRGSVVVPDSFTVRYEHSSVRRLVWAPVAGTGGYIVEIHGVTVPRYQPGTSFVLPERTPDEFRATVHAVDPALYEYLANGKTGRSGIDRGYGVLGAYTSARWATTP